MNPTRSVHKLCSVTSNPLIHGDSKTDETTYGIDKKKYEALITEPATGRDRIPDNTHKRQIGHSCDRDELHGSRFAPVRLRREFRDISRQHLITRL